MVRPTEESGTPNVTVSRPFLFPFISSGLNYSFIHFSPLFKHLIHTQEVLCDSHSHEKGQGRGNPLSTRASRSRAASARGRQGSAWVQKLEISSLPAIVDRGAWERVIL